MHAFSLESKMGTSFSIMGGIVEEFSRPHTLYPFQKFEWCLYNIDAYVCNLEIKWKWNELLCSREIVNRHFESKGCFSAASCKVLCEFLTEASISVTCDLRSTLGVSLLWKHSCAFLLMVLFLRSIITDWQDENKRTEKLGSQIW